MKCCNILLAVAMFWLCSCQSRQLSHSAHKENPLYKVSVFYPDGDGKTFDMEYYEQKHMPMVAGFLGNNLQFFEIDKGISGRTPNDRPPYLAVGYFYVKDVTAYNQAIVQNRDTVINDIRRYTNIQPVVQISEVRKIVSRKGR